MPATFLYHGTADALVPLATSKRMHEALIQSGCESELHIVEGKGHLTTFLDYDARQRVIAFLEKTFDIGPLMLPIEEYIEQAYFFRVLIERLGQNLPLQELLEQTKYEVLASTKLPMAIDLLLAELKHHGQMSSGMAVLKHYFVPFQTFLVREAETDRGRFDYRTAMRLLQAEADYRSKTCTPQGLFFFQFEAICRNRLNYDRGLKAMSDDPVFNADWSEWILIVRRQLGIIDLADLIYVRSQLYQDRRRAQGHKTRSKRLSYSV